MFLKWQVARCYKSHYAIFCIISTNTQTNKFPVQKSPSWEANRSSVNQKSPSSWQNPQVHYCAHCGSPHVPIVRQINPHNASPLYVINTNFNIIFPFTPWFSKHSPPSGFPTKILYAFPFSHSCRIPRPHTIHDWSLYNIWCGAKTMLSPHNSISSSLLLPPRL